MFKKQTTTLLTLALAGALIITPAFAQEENDSAADEAAAEAQEFEANVMASLHSQPELNRFSELLTKAGLDGRLNDGGDYTIFALDNAGMTELDELYPADDLSTFELLSVSHSFVLEGAVTPTELSGLEEVDSLGGYTYEVTADGDTITIDGADVDVAEAITADNGVIYVLSEPFTQISEYLEGLPAKPGSDD